MPQVGFDLDEHIYRNDEFSKIIDDAVRFFNGTPVHSLPPPVRFTGTGVYALYYTGKHPLYSRYAELNKFAYDFPIYVGKSVPKGWRQSRINGGSASKQYELYTRLREHSRTISVADQLDLNDFNCRFIVFDEIGSAMIGTLEAKLINVFKPLWNTVLDGFGNHTPGNGRFDQAKSDWDVIHPGRSWADRCRGVANKPETIEVRVKGYLAKLKA